MDIPPTTSPARQVRLTTADNSPPVALDELPDGVLLVNRAGRIEAANQAFLELTSRSRDGVIDRSVESLVAEEDMLSMVGFEAMFGEVRTLDNNVTFLAADGSRRVCVACAARSRDGQHVIMTVRAAGQAQEDLAHASRWAAAEQERSMELAAARDALQAKNGELLKAQAELQAAYAQLQAESAKRERLENELRVAQRLEAIGQLAAGVAHEINTPMQYIGDNVHYLSQAFSQLESYVRAVGGAAAKPEPGWSAARGELLAAHQKLEKKGVVSEIPKALAASKEGIAHVSRIVHAMKAFAYQDGQEKTPCDVNRALQDTLIISQNEYKDVAKVEMDLGTLPLLMCYPGKLNQVFLNLMVNAAHAIQDAKRAEPGSIRVSSRALPDAIEVRISDDGCGIPLEIRDKIFDQFFTTKQVGRGSGQGLSLARSIVVTGHGGTMTFESEVGRGTTFIVRLPLSDGGSKRPSAAPARGASERASAPPH